MQTLTLYLKQLLRFKVLLFCLFACFAVAAVVLPAPQVHGYTKGSTGVGAMDYGYFHNEKMPLFFTPDSGFTCDDVLPSSDGDVFGSAVGPNPTTDLSNFINIITSDYNSSNPWDKTGAAFIILTMSGYPAGTSEDTVGALDNNSVYSHWKWNVKQLAAGNVTGWTVTWGKTLTENVNTLYEENEGDNDVADFSQTVTALSIVFQGPGKQQYVIKVDCANPIGNISPPPPAPAPNFSCTVNLETTAAISPGSTYPIQIDVNRVDYIGSTPGDLTAFDNGTLLTVPTSDYESITPPINEPWTVTAGAGPTDTVTGTFNWQDPFTDDSDSVSCTPLSVPITPVTPAFSCTMSALSPEQVNKGFTVSYTVSGSGTDGGTFSMYGPDTNFYSKGITSPATYPYYGSGDMSVSSTGTETITGQFTPTNPQAITAYCSANIKITSPPPTFSCTMSALSPEQVNKGFTVSYTVSGSGTDGGTFSMYGPDTNFYSKGITSPATYPYYGSGDMSVSSTGTETITGQFTPTNPQAITAYCSANIKITSPPPTFSCTMSALSPEQVNKGFTVSYTVSGSGTDGGTFHVWPRHQFL